MARLVDQPVSNGGTRGNRRIAPHPPLRQYYGKPEKRQAFLNELFNKTAGQYRHLDRAVGLGAGCWYRKKALELAGLKPGMMVLDVACGPGLMEQAAVQLVGQAGFVIGLDPSVGMLREARRGGCQRLVQGVGERLPFRDQTFDFLSMGYALRHLSDLGEAFAEYWRVLKPGGIVLLLEVARPHSAILGRLLRWYLKDVLGMVLAVRSGDENLKRLMAYWWETIEQCVPPSTIVETLEEAGFVDCQVTERFGGLLRDYRAVKLAM
ncbi:MAG: class I SAM-dependent methyltransferase [Nitrospira sp.]|nr:class I SAM-dependent methyltransferase [Nitrospira sp.]